MRRNPLCIGAAILNKSIVLLCVIVGNSCTDLPFPSFIEESEGCPTPDEPYLHPEVCQSAISPPHISDIIFDPSGGKVPLRVRFYGDALAGVKELDAGVVLHWDLDGDGEEDTVTTPRESFYYYYEECVSKSMQVWASDELGRISKPLKKTLILRCNEKPVISAFSVNKDFGAPGSVFQFTVQAVDVDATNQKLIQGIDHIDWDMDGDGSFEQTSGATPLLVPLKYAYAKVGIFRPRIRVYDEEGDYAESSMLILSVLGSSEILQSIRTASGASWVHRRNDSVISVKNGALTVRKWNGSSMEQLSQASLGAFSTFAEFEDGARYGDYYYLTTAQQNNQLLVWAAAQTGTTHSEYNPARLRTCEGKTDHLNTTTKFGRYTKRVIAHSFDNGGTTEEYIFMPQKNDSVAQVDGVVYAADISRLSAAPATDRSYSSCVSGAAGVEVYKAVINLQSSGSNKIYYPSDLTAVGKYLLVASKVDGVRVVDLTGLRASKNNNNGYQNIVESIDNGLGGGVLYNSEYQARSIAAEAAVEITGSLGLYSTGMATDVVTMFTDRWIDPVYPVTFVADGVIVPVAVYPNTEGHSFAARAITMSRSDWDAHSLTDATQLALEYRTANIVVVGDAVKTALRVYALSMTSVPQWERVQDAGASSTPYGGKDGRMDVDGARIVHLVRAGFGFESGVFVSPVTDLTQMANVADARLQPYALHVDLTGDRAWIAANNLGVYAVDLTDATVGTANAARSYYPGDRPYDLVVDPLEQKVWLAEGKAGTHIFSYNSGFNIHSERRISAGYAVEAIAADVVNRKAYVAADSALLAYNLDDGSLLGAETGYAGIDCMDQRLDDTKNTLAFCSGNEMVVRALDGVGAISGTDSVFTVVEGDFPALGPQNAARPRLFHTNSRGLFIYCPYELEGQCANDLDKLPGTSFNSPAVSAYRYDDLDLILVGGKYGYLSFWNFTDTPGELGSGLLCDPQERWLPAALCTDEGITVRDIDVTGKYAFLGTTAGIFVIDIAEMPQLRVGGFITGSGGSPLPEILRVKSIYVGNGQYVVFGLTISSVMVFRFSQLQEP